MIHVRTIFRPCLWCIAQVCFELAGHRYEIDSETGAPQGRPDAARAWAIIASNPVACAQFFHTYLGAFIQIALGWDRRKKTQVNPACLFGRVDAWTYNVETSTRLMEHVHVLVSGMPAILDASCSAMRFGAV